MKDLKTKLRKSQPTQKNSRLLSELNTTNTIQNVAPKNILTPKSLTLAAQLLKKGCEKDTAKNIIL